MKIKNHNIDPLKILILLAIAIGLSSCQATKYLKENEKFLRKNRIIFDSPEKIEDKFVLKEEISALMAQKPAESILWVPRYWFYYYSKDKNNFINRYIKKSIAQPPPIFSKEKVVITAKNIKNFLRNKKGFYNAEVDYKIYLEKYLAEVDYILHTGRRYRINDVKYECENKDVLKIVNSNSQNSYLRRGDGADYINFNLEKARIKNLLQNNGYALFKQDNIELFGDSANYKVDLKVVINVPQDSNIFKIYKIGKINVFTDYYLGQNINELQRLNLDDITFYRELDEFLIKPEILTTAIPLHKGDIYSKQRDRSIYQKLSQFNIYKFITIKTEVDSTKSGILNYKIYLYAHEYKFYPEENIDIKYITLGNETNYLEFGLSGSLDNRKLSKRGDYISLSGSSDMKIDISEKHFAEINILGKTDYNNPFAPFSLKASPLYLYFIAFNKNKNYSYLKNNTLSQISFSYNYRTLLKKYKISALNLDYRYNFIPNKKVNVMVSQAGINYYSPKILDDSILNTTYQRKSMINVLSTGLFLKYFSYNYNYTPKNKLWNYFLKMGIELSGMEIFLTNKIYNNIKDRSGYWRFNDNISYAKFIKTHVEYIPRYKLSTTSSLAGRIFAGIGIPFGDTDVMPYNKQFQVGGPNSMRAWASRELGPGSYHKEDQNTNEIPYQKGDIRLEANLEYRFKLSYLFKSAFFVDAGNIWTLSYDEERIGSQFGKDFYKQIAIDAGVSLQLDIYVLIRFDLAFKLRNPYPDIHGSYWNSSFKQPTFVFAINHPF